MKKAIKLTIIFLMIFIFFYIFFKDLDMKYFFNEIKSIPLHYILIFFIGILAQLIVRAYRWGLILSEHKKIKLITLYSFTGIGYLLNFMPGKVGEIFRGIMLAKKEDFEESKGLASVVLERFIDMASILVVFLISFNFFPDIDFPLIDKLKSISLILLPILVIVLILFYLINYPKVWNWVEKIVDFGLSFLNEKWKDKLKGSILNFIKGLAPKMSFLKYLYMFFISLLVWFSLVPIYWILLYGCGIKTGVMSTIPYLCVIVASAAIPTPGMAGSLDAVSKTALEKLYTVPSAKAAAFTIIFHVLILLAMFVVGLFGFWHEKIDYRSIKEVKEKK